MAKVLVGRCGINGVNAWSLALSWKSALVRFDSAHPASLWMPSKSDWRIAYKKCINNQQWLWRPFTQTKHHFHSSLTASNFFKSLKSMKMFDTFLICLPTFLFFSRSRNTNTCQFLVVYFVSFSWPFVHDDVTILLSHRGYDTWLKSTSFWNRC